MGEVWEGLAGPQDPMFGIDHGNIVARVTRRNWRSKAVVRVHQSAPLYVFIGRVTRALGPKAGEVRYEVCVEGPRAAGFSKTFKSLREALSYANGEDGGLLATATRPAASAAEYPPEGGPAIVVCPVYRPERDEPSPVPGKVAR